MSKRILVKDLKRLLRRGGFYNVPMCLSSKKTVINTRGFSEKQLIDLLRYIDSIGLFYYNESPRLLPTYYSIEWKEKK
jgi:hypothetical protein